MSKLFGRTWSSHSAMRAPEKSQTGSPTVLAVMSKLKLGHVRATIGLVICLTLLSYLMFWHSGLSLRPMLLGVWYSHHRKEDVLCMQELLTAFNIAAVSTTAPTYVRLKQPLALSANSSCRHLLAKPVPPLPRGFQRFQGMDSAHQLKIHSIMQDLLTNFSQRHMELFMVGGSLLGSMRHFGFFPWDSDIDVMIPTSQKAQARRYLIELSASDEFRFVDTERTNQHWQLGIFCKPEVGKPPTKLYGTEQLYPAKTCLTIVDFFFGRVDGRVYRRLEHPMSFPIEHVYPLKPRPYGPYLIPAPREPEKFLNAVYGGKYEALCLFKYFGDKRFPCASLRSAYQFVAHLRLPYEGQLIKFDVLELNSTLLAIFIPQRLN